MEQDLRVRARKRAKARVDAIPRVRLLHPVTVVVWDPAVASDRDRAKDAAADRAVEGDRNE